MAIETVLSMLAGVCHFKRVEHWVWRYFKMRLVFMMAAFNICMSWDGLQVDERGFVPLS